MARKPGVWRRGGGAWYTTIGGKQRKVAEATATQAAAEAALARLLAPAVPVDAGGERTVGEILERFLTDREGKVEPATLQGYESMLGLAFDAIGSMPISRLTDSDVERWIAGTAWSPGRRRLALSVFLSAMKWARVKARMEGVPSLGVRLPPAPRREFDATADVRAKVLAEAATFGGYLVDLAEACIETGCRPGEVAKLTADDVDLARGTWVVVNKTRRATGRRTRTIYLSDRAAEITRRLAAEHPTGPIFRNRDGRAWRRSDWERKVRVIRERLGLPELVLYSMRHAYITDALEANINPVVVAELAGHTDLSMIMKVYSKIARRRATLSEAARQIRPAAPPAPQAAPAPDTPGGAEAASPPPASGTSAGKRPGRSGPRRSGGGLGRSGRT